MAIMATHGDYYVTNPAKVGLHSWSLEMAVETVANQVSLSSKYLGGMLFDGVVDFRRWLKMMPV